MPWVLKVEQYKDGRREVYHHWQKAGRRAGITDAHTHPDTPEARAACHPCQDPERKAPR